MKPYNIYISGVGGQGIIKTSIVIAEAAMKSGNEVVMSEVHGMAQRGGVVSTELKIGHARSPLIGEGNSDLMIAFEPLEAIRAINMLSEKSYVICNTSPIMPFNIIGSKYPYPKVSDILFKLESKSNRLFSLDALEIATQAGHLLSMNMVMLGAAAAVPGFPVEQKLLRESMKDNLPEKSLDINLKAFEIGYKVISS